MKDMQTGTDGTTSFPAPVIVSACLLGLPTRYDAGPLEGVSLPERLRGRMLIPVCPEQLGGLPTPRPQQELRGGTGADVLKGRARVVNREGTDVTASFVRAAGIVCQIAQALGADEACLKDGSPSCGVTRVTVDGKETSGFGVTAAAIKNLGLTLHPCG
jgi:uncharacterized protein YbbK (DUF523 family)